MLGFLKKVIVSDINQARIEELNNGFDRTLELTSLQLQKVLDNGLKFTIKSEEIKDSNLYIVTAPIPIDSNNEPDLTPIVNSTETIGKVLKKDDIVI